MASNAGRNARRVTSGGVGFVFPAKRSLLIMPVKMFRLCCKRLVYV